MMMGEGKVGAKRNSLFYVSILLFWFAQYIYMPFLNPFMSGIGITATVIGAIGGVYGVTQLVLRIPLSIGASLVSSHKPIIIGGLFAVVVSCLLPVFSHSWIAFFMMRALAGVSSSTWISYTSYQLECAGDTINSRMGLVMACYMGGISLSQILGTAIYDIVGINGLFYIGALAAALGAILIVLTPFRPRFEKKENKKQFDWSLWVGAIKNKHLWMCSIIMSIGWWAMFSSSWGFTGVFASEKLGATSVQVGLIAFVCQMASVFISLVFGRLKGRKLPERALLICAFVLLGIYCVLSPHCPGATYLIILQLVGGAAISVPNVLLFANAGRELSSAQQIFSMGIFQSVYSIGITVGPIVSGLIVDAAAGGFTIMFYSLGIVSAIGAAMVFFFYKSR
ncbi:MAG: MFS transporter [Clostridiales Family XIII bacterium]|jgi:predicted MFS family arabinose efflux permease|nr:MFS transporter [Clostridiales Family XIII bacterium]